jgi:hypothetical protein
MKRSDWVLYGAVLLTACVVDMLFSGGLWKPAPARDIGAVNDCPECGDSCPECGPGDHVVPIQYGLYGPGTRPSGVMGGCVFRSGISPVWHCTKCKREFGTSPSPFR